MAISALAVIAHQAGHHVSGSDPRPSKYLPYLRERGISDLYIGKDASYIAHQHAAYRIDWCVVGSAQEIDYPSHPELVFCREHGIRLTKRGPLLSTLIRNAGIPLVAVAGTHGKTTTTMMMIWLLRNLGLDVSYAVGAPVDGPDMGRFDPSSQYFVYEADEFDRNFLHFEPDFALISGVDWDHHDVYPTRSDYYAAFYEFTRRSKNVVMWEDDAGKLDCVGPHITIASKSDSRLRGITRLVGQVNRQNAWLVAMGASILLRTSPDRLAQRMQAFPGVSRRFEAIAPGLFSDYAHTSAKIRGALQCAEEKASGEVVVVYEGLHNARQHFMRDDLEHIFDAVAVLYVVPTFLGREDRTLEILKPQDLIARMSGETRARAFAAELDEDLALRLRDHLAKGALVLCLSAGHSRSLDDWVRREF